MIGVFGQVSRVFVFDSKLNFHVLVEWDWPVSRLDNLTSIR